jgi:hypothetical protein
MANIAAFAEHAGEPVKEGYGEGGFVVIRAMK